MQFHFAFEVVCYSNSDSKGRTFIFPVDLKTLKRMLHYICYSINISTGKSLSNSPFQPIPFCSCMNDESGRAMKER